MCVFVQARSQPLPNSKETGGGGFVEHKATLVFLNSAKAGYVAVVCVCVRAVRRRGYYSYGAGNFNFFNFFSHALQLLSPPEGEPKFN